MIILRNPVTLTYYYLILSTVSNFVLKTTATEPARFTPYEISVFLKKIKSYKRKPVTSGIISILVTVIHYLYLL